MPIKEAGIDTDTFKAHSVRGAACSSEAWSSVMTTNIISMQHIGEMKASFNRVKFYHQTVQYLDQLPCHLLIRTYKLTY